MANSGRQYTLQTQSGGTAPVNVLHSVGARTRAMVFATVNVSIAATGTGFLSFPFAFATAGLLGGTLLCVGTSVVCAYSLIIIATCARDHGARSYQELVLRMFGESTRQLVQWLVIIFNFTGNIVSLQVISSQVATLLGQLVGPHIEWFNQCMPLPPGETPKDHNCIAMSMAVVTVLVTPLCLLRSMESLGPTSFLGACCVLFTSIVVSVHGLMEPETTPGHAAETISFHLTAFQAISIVCFATMCHFTVVPATAELSKYFPPDREINYTSIESGPSNVGKTPTRILWVLCVCVMLWCNVLYIPVGILGYRAFGDQVQSNVLTNFGLHPHHSSGTVHFIAQTADVTIARACMALTVTLSYPIFTYITRMAIFDVLNGCSEGRSGSAETLLEIRRQDSAMDGSSFQDRISTTQHVTVTIIFLYTCLAAGALVVYMDVSLGFTVSIIGATVVVAVEFFLPAAMCWQLRRPVSTVVLVLVGVAILVLGLFITVADEVCDDHSNKYGTSTQFCVDIGASGPPPTPAASGGGSASHSSDL